MIRHAFTLIEILIVMTVMALLAGFVALRLSTTVRNLSLRDAAEQVAELDSLARSAANSSRCETNIVFDLNANRAAYTEPLAEEEHAKVIFGRNRLTRIRLTTGAADHGRETIVCSPTGQTPTYALELTSPDNRKCWVCVTGLTGRVEVFSNEKAIDETFSVLDATRHEPR